MYSCSNRQMVPELEQVVTINLDSGKSNESISKSIQVTKVLSLRCSDSVSISNSNYIKKIIQIKDKNYIFDSKFMTINVFDTIGNYIGQVGSLGKGYGQFSNVQDIMYGNATNRLIVLCNSPNKIIEFSPDGEVLKETPLSFFASNFTNDDSDSYYFFRNQNFEEDGDRTNLVRTDNKYRIKSDFFQSKDGLETSVSFTGAVFGNETEILYNPPFENTIYKIIKDQGIEKFKVDFGSSHNIINFSQDSVPNYLQNKSFITNNLVLVDNLLLFNYVREGSKNVAIVDRDASIIYSSEADDLLDDFFNEGMFYDGNSLVIVMTPAYKANFSDPKKSALEQRFPVIYEKLYNNENCGFPIIVYFEFKKG